MSVLKKMPQRLLMESAVIGVYGCASETENSFGILSMALLEDKKKRFKVVECAAAFGERKNVRVHGLLNTLSVYMEFMHVVCNEQCNMIESSL